MTQSQGPTPAADPAPQLVPNLNDQGEEEYDSDSAYSGSIAGTGTTSLKSSITKYREEGGRTYHAYGSTEHWGPNDEKAQDQQDLTHHLWVLSLKGALYTAPVENPKRILDLGTGTGIWAIEVAEQHPDAVVEGIDLSPIQPTWLPPNVRFLVDDYNSDWVDTDKYDLVNARELLGTVPDWVSLYKQALGSLRPGGWFNQAEPGIGFKSDHKTFDEKHCYFQWEKIMREAGMKAGLRFDIAQHLKGWMEEAGFVNVREVQMPWTIGGWSKDKHLREVGQWNQVRWDIGVKDFCGRRMTNQMGMRSEEIEVFCAEMRNTFRNKKLYAYQLAYFVCGQKPAGTLSDTST